MIVASQIRALALNIWLEALRDRVVIILAGSGLLMLLASMILGRMAVGGPDRVIQSMGFWVLGMWGLLAMLYLGAGIVRREFQQKTVYLILSRPVHRATFLLGKFSGISLVLATLFVVLALFFGMLLALSSITIQTQHAWAIAFIFGEWILLASLSLFFASFTSPILHNFFLVGFTFLGHWSGDLRIFAENVEEPFLKNFLLGLHYGLPNLEILNFRKEALFDLPIPPDVILQGMVVLFFWILTLLVTANVIFSRRRIL